MANIAYVRATSVDQNADRQTEALQKYHIDKWFSAKVYEKNKTDRKQLRDMLEWVREGDTGYVFNFSSLARSTKDLLFIVEKLNEKNVHLISMKENLDTSTPNGKLMVAMIADINEFEHQNLLERQAEGIAIAKKKGVYKGRKRIEIKDFGNYYDAYMNREISKSGIAKKLNVSRPTVDRLIKEYKDGVNGD